MNEAKIRLSPKEEELIHNTEFILTKNEIIKKVNLLFSGILEQQKKITAELSLPVNILTTPPKISKGENYRGLPYLVLDYPRLFEKEDVMAVRTMFWWGHFFSTTLHVSGLFKNKLEKRIEAGYDLFATNNFFCCVNSNQWQHHFESNNYRKIDEINKDDFSKVIGEKSFIKIAAKTLLSPWDKAEEKLVDDFKLLVNLAGD
jgi:hypothetical protein